ncbi:MAG: hypothetical protein C1941_02130 [Prosthecochloris sp.]|nr:hypothetical protein [Prosthecochloris sp.]
MKHDACVARLEKKLSLERQQLIEFLDAVMAGFVEELVRKGDLSVKGLGLFTVLYLPFRSKVDGRVMKAFPPRKKIAFYTRPVVDTATLRIIGRKTGLSERDADTFFRILSGHFRERLAAKQELLLEGLGVFRTVEGKYLFVPDEPLQEIVNNVYENMKILDLGGQ